MTPGLSNSILCACNEYLFADRVQVPIVIQESSFLSQKKNTALQTHIPVGGEGGGVWLHVYCVGLCD
jgi:hypothetical protein